MRKFLKYHIQGDKFSREVITGDNSNEIYQYGTCSY